MIPYTTIPFLSAIFLVFVGVLMGHLFWYRFREEQETRTDHWKEKATRLQTALDSQTNAQEELEARWSELRQQADQWYSQLSMTQSMVATLEKERDEYQSQWDQERETRLRMSASYEEEQHETSSWRDRCQKAESLVSQLETRVADQTVSLEKSLAELEQLRKASRDAASDAEAAQHELIELRSRAKDWETNHSKLLQQFQDSQSVENELRHSLADQKKQFAIQSDQLAVLHDQLRKQLKAAEAQVEMEQVRYAELLSLHEQHLAGQDQSQRETSELVAELARMKEQLARETEKSQQLAAQLNSETNARKQLHETMQHQSRREQVLLDEIVPLRVAAEEARKLKKEVASQKTQIEAAQVTQHDLQVRIDEYAATRAHLEDELKLVRSEVQTQQKKLHAAQSELDTASQELAKMQKELELHRSDLAARDNRLLEQLKDRDSVAAELQSLQALHAEEQERTESLGQMLLEFERQVAHFQEQQIEWANQEANWRAQYDRERKARELAESKLEATRQELDQLQSVDEALGERDTQVRQLQDELRESKRSRDEALAAASSTREIVAELRDELSDRLESFEISESEKTTALRELQLERQRREQLAEASQRWEHEWRLMQQQLNDALEQRTTLEKLRQESTDRVGSLQQQLEELEARSRESLRRAEQADARSQELLARLDQQEELNRRLRSKRFAEREAMSGDPRGGSLSFRGIRTKEMTQRESDEAGIYRDPRFGRLFMQAPHRIDDLTRIPGIDGLLRDALHRLGVYTFRQIMEWDSKNVQEVGRQLGLRDAIDRDDWVGNARRLHHQLERAVA